jgi:hypothetical protein
MIIEEVPNVSLKIKTHDGNVFVYKIEQVMKLEKKEIDSDDNSENKNPDNDYSENNNSENGGYERKEPGMAFLCSFLVPGLGQYINGGDDVNVGILCDALYLGGFILIEGAGTQYTYYNDSYFDGYEEVSNVYATSSLSTWYYVGLGTMATGWIIGMVDAPMYANDYNKKHKHKKHEYGELLEFPGDQYSLGINASLMNQSQLTSAIACGPQITATLHF